MAEKRMISKSISVSEKVNSLPSTFDMLLYTWIIPHTDDFGRMPGSPLKVKALVVPMLDKSINDIEESLVRINNAGLIDWYEVDGDKYIQVINFEKHQTGLHKRTNSKFPEPPVKKEEIPIASETFPEIPGNSSLSEVNRSEQKGSEGKGSEGSKNAPTTADVFLTYQKSFGVMSSMNQQILSSYMDDGMQPSVILEAFERTLNQADKPTFKYANSILNDWITRGLKNIDEVRKHDPPKENKKLEGESSAKHWGSSKRSDAAATEEKTVYVESPTEWKRPQRDL